MSDYFATSLFEENTAIRCKKRSANALTCVAPVRTRGGEDVFVKVSALATSANYDSILVDAINSEIVRRNDPQSIWSVGLRGIDRCDVRGVSDTVAVVAPGGRYCALSFAVVAGAPVAELAPGIQVRFIMKGALKLLWYMIRCSAATGMTHNDMHVGNVMMNAFGEMRVIDYGRMQFGRGTLGAHEPVIDAVMGIAIDRGARMQTWADPFINFRASDFRPLDGVSPYDHLYWTADLITFSLQLYTRLRRAVPHFPAVGFLDNTLAVARFWDEDDLSVRLAQLGDALQVLKPGLALYAILLKSATPRGVRMAYSNFTLTKEGGAVLHGLFKTGALKKTYGVVLSSAFRGAGLSIANQIMFPRPAAGGAGPSSPEAAGPPDLPETAGPPDLPDTVDPLGRARVAGVFPRDQFEAAEQKWRMLSERAPAKPWQAGGSGRRWAPPVLAAAVLLASVFI